MSLIVELCVPVLQVTVRLVRYRHFTCVCVAFLASTFPICAIQRLVLMGQRANPADMEVGTPEGRNSNLSSYLGFVGYMHKHRHASGSGKR